MHAHGRANRNLSIPPLPLPLPSFTTRTLVRACAQTHPLLMQATRFIMQQHQQQQQHAAGKAGKASERGGRARLRRTAPPGPPLYCMNGLHSTDKGSHTTIHVHTHSSGEQHTHTEHMRSPHTTHGGRRRTDQTIEVGPEKSQANGEKNQPWWMDEPSLSCGLFAHSADTSSSCKPTDEPTSGPSETRNKENAPPRRAPESTHDTTDEQRTSDDTRHFSLSPTKLDTLHLHACRR
mmetsp:Transcript_20150/g.57621  ORF Transcript_20150/g.57621 Transcript_20150/m.57621 type:complete len:235 (-) Transcript_20150:82-786(-)